MGESNPATLTLKIKKTNEDSDIIVNNDQEIALSNDRPTILIGLNASLKSIIARTFLEGMFSEKYKQTFNKISLGTQTFPDESTVKRYLKPTLSTLGVNYEISYKGELGESLLLDYIADSRIVLRSFFVVNDKIKNLVDIIKNELNDRSEFVLPLIDEIIGKMGFDFVRKYVCLKGEVDANSLTEMNNILSQLIKSASKELEIDETELMPLDVEITGKCSDITRNDFAVHIRDKRFKKKIEAHHVSTSVSSFLLIKYLTIVLSNANYDSKIIIIEEPEQAMAPPQQVLFMKILEEMLRYTVEGQNIGKAFVLLTTHSPYISLVNVPANHYFISLNKNKELKVVEGDAGSTFLMANLLRLKYRGDEL